MRIEYEQQPVSHFLIDFEVTFHGGSQRNEPTMHKDAAFITIAECMRRSGFSRATIEAFIYRRDNPLPAYRIPKTKGVRINAEEFNQLLNSFKPFNT